MIRLRRVNRVFLGYWDAHADVAPSMGAGQMSHKHTELSRGPVPTGLLWLGHTGGKECFVLLMQVGLICLLQSCHFLLDVASVSVYLCAAQGRRALRLNPPLLHLPKVSFTTGIMNLWTASSGAGFWTVWAALMERKSCVTLRVVIMHELASSAILFVNFSSGGLKMHS